MNRLIIGRVFKCQYLYYIVFGICKFDFNVGYLGKFVIDIQYDGNIVMFKKMMWFDFESLYNLYIEVLEKNLCNVMIVEFFR